MWSSAYTAHWSGLHLFVGHTPMLSFLPSSSLCFSAFVCCCVCAVSIERRLERHSARDPAACGMHTNHSHMLHALIQHRTTTIASLTLRACIAARLSSGASPLALLRVNIAASSVSAIHWHPVSVSDDDVLSLGESSE